MTSFSSFVHPREVFLGLEVEVEVDLAQGLTSGLVSPSDSACFLGDRGIVLEGSGY